MFHICANRILFVLVSFVVLQVFSTTTNCGAAERVEPVRVDRFGDALPARAVMRFGSVRLHDYFGLHCVEFTPDGKSLATGGGSGIVIWDLSDGRELRRFSAPSPVRAIKFSADGRWVGIQMDDGVAISKLSPDAPLSLVELGKGDLLGFDRDSKRVVVNGEGAIQVFDAGSGKEVKKFSYKPETFKACAFNATSNAVAFVDLRGKLVLASIGNSAVPRVLRKSTKGEYVALTISDDGTRLACMVVRDDEDNQSWEEDGGYVDVIEIASGTKLARIRPHVLSVDEDTQIRISPDLGLLALSSCLPVADGSPDSTCVFRVTDGKQVAQLACVHVIFSSDGKLIAGVQGSGAGLWRTTTWERRFPEFGHGGGGFAIVVSPDERFFASADGECLSMWEIESGKQVWRQDLSPYHGFGAPLAFTADGRSLLVNRSNAVEALTSATGDKINRYPFGPFNAASSDGALGIYWDNQGFRLQFLASASKGPLLSGFFNETNRTGVAISPDGSLIAGTGVLKLRPDFQNRLVFWRTPTGEQVFLADSKTRAETFPFFIGDHLLGTLWHNPKGWEHLDFSLIIRETFTGGICDEIPIGDIDANEPLAGAVGPDVWVAISHRREKSGTTGDSGSILIRNLLESDATDAVAPIKKEADDAIFLRSRWALLCVHSGEILLWQLPPNERRREQQIDSQEFERLWNDLGADSRTAWKAIKSLRISGDRAISFLQGRLAPTAIAAAKIQSLVEADLQATSDAARRQAQAGIVALGSPATLEVQRLRNLVSSQRVRDDLDAALDRWSCPIINDPDELRRIRSILLLELIGTAGARAALAATAGGPSGARETVAAKRALDRLEAQFRAARR